MGLSAGDQKKEKALLRDLSLCAATRGEQVAPQWPFPCVPETVPLGLGLRFYFLKTKLEKGSAVTRMDLLCRTLGILCEVHRV